MAATWMTSMTEFAPITLPVLNHLNPKRIAEIGASAGGHSKLLCEFLRPRQGELFSIDPMPQQMFIDFAAQNADVVRHIKQPSLQGIGSVKTADIWFIDGDHNWYTVFNELQQIEAHSAGQPYLLFLHDVSWPCARRDMYYSPESIPAEFRKPYSSELGITLDQPASFAGGFKGPNWALEEGGPRNGVLTAVEDFMAVSQRKLHWLHVPAVLGLGVLVDTNHPAAKDIVEYYAPFHNNPLLQTLERDRIKKYLQLLEQEQKLSKMSLMLGNLSRFCEAV